VIISCVADTYSVSSSLADLVFTKLNNSQWSDTTNNIIVLSCYLDAREESSHEISNTKTVSLVDMRFVLSVKSLI
jgi:hypothetical protein